jgi:3-methyladenine DNA glycosylase/8-oxoguanine DNA glycosylase
MLCQLVRGRSPISCAEVWKPYRTWVALLLRIMLEDETHEIAGQAITRTPGL